MGNFMVCLGLLFVAYMADVADCLWFVWVA